jgi:hypothetical protein
LLLAQSWLLSVVVLTAEVAVMVLVVPKLPQAQCHHLLLDSLAQVVENQKLLPLAEEVVVVLVVPKWQQATHLALSVAAAES